LAKTHDLIVNVEKAMDRYDSYVATNLLRDFADVLTNWYVRRSRDRFWEGSPEGFDTLYTVLETLCRVAAPLLPMVTEEVWKGLTNGRSVHLTDWPNAKNFPADDKLVSAMDQIRSASSVSNALRKAASLRNRLPLAKLTVVTTDSADLEQFTSLLAEELNVKAIELVELDETSGERFGVVKQLTVNSRVAGPRLGANVQHVIRGAKSGAWSLVDGKVVVDGVELLEEEYELTLVADLSAGDTKNLIGILPSGGFVILDGDVTPELEVEGAARDLIRAIQQTRKDSGLDVSDRIKLSIAGDDATLAAIAAHEELIKSETLTLELVTSSGSGEPQISVAKL
jgi:isoleucyl-tRNA synthetase